MHRAIEIADIALLAALQVTRQWEQTQALVNISLADPSSDHPHQLRPRLVLIRVDVGLAGLNVTFSDRSHAADE